MKKIEAIFSPKYERQVIDALRSFDLGGLTIINGRGRGKGPRKIKEGLGRYIEPFAEFDILFTVVEDSKVDSILTAIADAAHTGSLGDGKIFVSTVDSMMDITTKQMGEKHI